MIDPSGYEQWLTLIQVTAFVLRGVRAFKSGASAGSKELSAEELQDAKLSWYWQIQQEVYQAEYERLKEDLPLPNTSAILKLDPYYDKRDHLLRVGGRLQHSDVPEGTKHPIILPHGHAVVYTRSCFMLDLRVLFQSYDKRIWLTKGRREIKRVLGKCLVCQRQRVGPCSQKMAPLPSERVSLSLAFTHVGIDFAGPLFVRGSASSAKAYICIFTCASSRMTHQELTGDLSTNEFFQAFIRMISTRALCSTIWSDNAKTFKRVDHEIQQLFTQGSSVNKQLWDKIDQEKLQPKLSSKGIKWKFLVERSPWHGGWWEILVRSVKESLRKVLGKALLSYQELATVLTRIKAVINLRPLTTVSDDIRDLTPITPAHLALGRSLFSVPDLEDEVSANKTTTRQSYLY